MKRSLLVAAFVTLLVGAMAAPGVARPGELEVAADGFLFELIDPGVSTIDGDVWHIRGFTGVYRIVGTGENAEFITGDILSVIDWNWNLKTGTAHVQGKYDLSLGTFDGGYSGTFWTFNAAHPGGIAGPDFDPANPATWPCVAWKKAKTVGQGYGELEGAQFRTNLSSDTCGAFFTQAGSVFFPGG